MSDAKNRKPGKGRKCCKIKYNILFTTEHDDMRLLDRKWCKTEYNILFIAEHDDMRLLGIDWIVF